jgi:hypothetical protein
MTGPGEDWLLFLSAGASAVCPTHLPTFDALSTAILAGLGWARIPSGSAERAARHNGGAHYDRTSRRSRRIHRCRRRWFSPVSAH